VTGCSGGLRHENCAETGARRVTAVSITGDTGVPAVVFEPACARVARGSELSFVNEDKVQHNVSTVAGMPASFSADLPKKGSTYARAFDVAGAYAIRCRFHGERMVLLVTG
jgi:plastocyanin